MSEQMSEKEKVVDRMIRHTLSEIQRSGAGRFRVDPRTWDESAATPAMIILEGEYKLVQAHESGLSASQRAKLIKFYEQFNPPAKETKPDVQANASTK